MSRPRLRVLLSSAGRRVELLELFLGAGAAQVTVIAADACPELSPACQLVSTAVRVPPASSDEFVPAMKALCDREEIDLLVPTIDPELLPLAQAMAAFLPTHVVVSDPDAVVVTGDKLATARHLAAVGLPVPTTALLPLGPLDGVRVPFVVKPASGSSSIGVYVVNDSRRHPGPEHAGYVAQDLLRGTECTVNCYVSTRGQLLAAVPHARLSVRGGEVAKGETIRHPALGEAARTISESLPGLKGPFCFQAFVVGSSLEGVIEINARFGGGYPLTHAAGADFVELILLEHLGRDVAPLRWSPGVRMLRYDRSVFNPS